MTAHDKVDAFNAAHDVGVGVRYWPILPKADRADIHSLLTYTKTVAYIVEAAGGDIALVFLVDFDSPVNLDHVEVES